MVISGLAIRATRRQSHLRSSYIGIFDFVRGRRLSTPRHLKQKRCFSASGEDRNAKDGQSSWTASQDTDSAKKRVYQKSSTDIRNIIKAYDGSAFHLMKTDSYNKHISFQKLLEIAEHFDEKQSREIVLTGYLGAVRKANKNLFFGVLADPHMRNTIQIVARNPQRPQSDPATVPVSNTGEAKTPPPPEDNVPDSPAEVRPTQGTGDTAQEGAEKNTQDAMVGSNRVEESFEAISSSNAEEASSVSSDTVSEADQLQPPDDVEKGHGTENMSSISSSSPIAITDRGNSASSKEQNTNTVFSGLKENAEQSGVSKPNAAVEGSEGDKGPSVDLKRSWDHVSLNFRELNPHTPITIWGRIRRRSSPKSQDTKDPLLISEKLHDTHFGNVGSLRTIEIEVSWLKVHNWNPGLRLRRDVEFAPAQRHLQLRTSGRLRHALRKRSKALAEIRKALFNDGFDEIETPLLFRSSREGAREFIVPSRARGRAYALPQSPQQYKQILMASGVAKYFQFAKCFRDEDMRTDRQPEFTQLDMEMSFADQRTVLATMERVIRSLWKALKYTIPETKHYPYGAYNITTRTATPFDQLYYEDAMRSYGSDKPDRRFGSIIHQPGFIPQDLISKVTTLKLADVDMMKFEVSRDPAASRKFITDFLESEAGKPFRPNPVNAPGVFILDNSKPMQGLSAFGFYAAEKTKELVGCENGDLVIVSARPGLQKQLFSGSSTPMGDMRVALFKAAVEQGYRHPSKTDDFVWITQFPLFEKDVPDELGQGGRAGIRARHHPFTAPSFHDAQALYNIVKHPLLMRGESWDLVINGVEVGGGSVRIHRSSMQELILRDVLKMTDSDLEAFRPLLNALDAKCPPHAGMALGFDRLLAVLLNKKSIRDVIAFPKFGGKGEDYMVGSPATITSEQLETYGLQHRGKKPEPWTGGEDYSRKEGRFRKTFTR